MYLDFEFLFDKKQLVSYNFYDRYTKRDVTSLHIGRFDTDNIKTAVFVERKLMFMIEIQKIMTKYNTTDNKPLQDKAEYTNLMSVDLYVG